ncbi:hypothetical protein IM660_11035 [Ruania alkalisoli]|uniref:Integral membrane protein n=1 Tax=Ruania alkalisoli TaxID=2779775 RepID=A0A7M1SP42_9MICO|nr:hypothetical protein [Ruania alkalisoli]QOR69245.1 hypothetical protein IM660_11035 [Ruania alkalisoli]
MSQQPPEQGPQDPAQEPNSGQPQQPGTPPPPPGQPSYGAAAPPPSGYPSPEQGGFQTPPPPGPGPAGQYGAPGPGYGGPPQAPGVNAGQYGQGGYPGGSQPFGVGAALGYAWKTVFGNPVVWIVGALLVAIVYALVSLLNPSTLAAFDAANGSFNVATSQSFTAMGIIASLLTMLVVGFVQAVAQNAALRETAGNKPTFGDIFQVPNMQNALIWAVIWGVGSTIINLIPGIGPLLVLVASVLVIFTMPAIIDRGLPWIEGVKTSVQLVQQNAGSTILLVLAFIGISILGALACLLGLLIALPMIVVATAFAYRSFSGQPIAPRS